MTFDQMTLDKNQAVLLVIDIQDRLAPAISGSDEIVRQAGVLIQAAHELNLPILVTEQYPKGLGSTVRELSSLLAGVQPAASVFAKMSFSAFIPECRTELERLNRHQIVMAGMETHVCVFQTARDLQNAGYQVFLAQDAVGSRTLENKQNGLELIRACGATITNTESVLFVLLKEAGTPKFKFISKLIK